MTTPTLDDVQDYWNRHPAGAAEVAHLKADRIAYFDERDRQTALLYPTLDEDYEFHRTKGRRTLELGCGMGYNAQCLARAGANLVVMDLAEHAVRLTKERFALRDLPADFIVADAENLPFKSEVFDEVFSSGVIHHSPDTNAAAKQIERTLKPDGNISVMLYHKNSIWYWWDIVIKLGGLMAVLNFSPAFIRNALVNRAPHWKDLVMPAGHRLTLTDVVRSGTDFGGLQNPISRVYTHQSSQELFSGLREFRFVSNFNATGALEDPKSLKSRLIGPIVDRLNRRWGFFLMIRAKK